MRDYQTNFGAASLETAGTRADCANPLDFAAVQGSMIGRPHPGHAEEPLSVVVRVPTAFASGDSFTPIIVDSADGSSWAEIARGKSSGAAPVAGYRQTLALPRTHRRYLNVGGLPASGGSFTARTIEAWLEPGPNEALADL